MVTKSRVVYCEYNNNSVNNANITYVNGIIVISNDSILV